MKTTAFICASILTMAAGLTACCLLIGCASGHSGEVAYRPIEPERRAPGIQFVTPGTNSPLSYQWRSTNGEAALQQLNFGDVGGTNGPILYEWHRNTNTLGESKPMDAGTGTTEPPQQNTSHSEVRKFPNLLAHIQHDGDHFSVSLNQAEKSFLTVHISEKSSVLKSSPPPAVKLRVQMADDTVIEGPAQKPPVGYGNGGWDELDFRFELKRRVLLDDIHSVTVTINSHEYTLSPF